ncbi:5679_t:CDS:2, partial [Funneliformis geosporum]
MVVDYSAGLCVIDLHNEAKAFNFTTKDDSVAEEKNRNAGYIFVHNQEAEHSLILLLPEYVIFTTAAQGVERLAFYCMLKKYGLDSNTCLRSILESSENPWQTNAQNILFGIQVESDEKVLSPKPAQTLMLKKTKNNETDITSLNNSEIQKLVEKEIEGKQLGSTIFMSTSQYFFIPLSLPYPNCHDLLTSNQTFYTTVLGFSISCNITCLFCKTSTQYSNKDSEVKYSHLVA